MKSKIQLAAVLTATIMLSACTQTQAPSGANSGSSSDIQSQTNATGSTGAKTSPNGGVWDPSTPYPELVTFTRGFATSNVNLPAGKTLDDNGVMDYVRDKVNVEAKVAWEVDGNNFDQKVALSIASKDIPDMLRVSRTLFKQMVENDLVWDMTEAFELCASDYVKEMYESYGDRLLAQTMVDGQLKGLPGTNIGNSSKLLFVRKDWLNKLGLEEPKTMDEVVNVAKAFIEKDPGGNGAGNTIGILLHDTITANYNGWHGFETVFSLYDAYPKLWIEVDGKAAYGSIQPETKDALLYLNQLYKDGIIDKEFALRKDAERQEIISSGKAGLMFAAWWGGGGIKEAVINNPEAEWIPLAAPLDGNGKVKAFEHDPVNGIAVFSKKFKNPEAFVKALNYSYEIWRGIGTDGKAAYEKLMKEYPGVGWQIMPVHIQIDYMDVTKRILDDVNQALKNGGRDAMKTVGTSVYYDHIESMLKDPVKTKAEKVDAYNTYLGRYLATEAATNGKYELKKTVFFGRTETMDTKWSNLEKLEIETFTKIIMGDLSIDAFDKFVEDWKKQGGDEITAEVEIERPR